jgi:hypothetical protein
MKSIKRMTKRNISSEKMEKIKELSQQFTNIISVETLQRENIYWGGNGAGDRWINQPYSVIYSNGTTKTYNDEKLTLYIPEEVLSSFMSERKIGGRKIIGVYVYDENYSKKSRAIKESILKFYKNCPCVLCGIHHTVCDHKNDLYNDERVLNTATQTKDDFQPLCNACNLRKREISNKEKERNELWSAGKNLEIYKLFVCDIPIGKFPWELKVFDMNDPDCKKDTFWYDPIEFNRKISIYLLWKPILKDIKRRIRLIR